MKLRFLVTRKRIIKEIAENIAYLQKRADEVYYRDAPPKRNGNDHASWLLDQVEPLKFFSIKLGICEQVYQEAYKIYDFRNSGKEGYTLRDGKIVLQDEF
jgi:hypothetical protein